jgi:hypothetical protein
VLKDTPKRRDRLETLIATLLGLAAVLVAVASYQGSLRDGDSIKSFNLGIRSINDANGFYNEAVQTVARDQALFLEFAKASQDNKGDLATYLRTSIMDNNLRRGVTQWLNDKTDKIETPIDAPAYEVPAQGEAERLEKLTDRQFAEAQSLDDEGDRYNLVGVIVASSLFFLGIAGVMRNIRTKVVGTALGAVSLVASIAIYATI